MTLIDALNPILKKQHSVKKGSSWYRETDETIFVINLQKSNYGQQYYLNLAVWLKSLGTQKYPKENQCHIRLRIDSLKGAEKYDIASLLDLENKAISDQERKERIENLLTSYSSYFDLFGKLQTIAGLERSGELIDAFIDPQTTDVLSDIELQNIES